MSVLYVLERFADLSFDLVAELHIVCQESFHSLASLSQLALPVAEP